MKMKGSRSCCCSCSCSCSCCCGAIYAVDAYEAWRQQKEHQQQQKQRKRKRWRWSLRSIHRRFCCCCCCSSLSLSQCCYIYNLCTYNSSLHIISIVPSHMKEVRAAEADESSINSRSEWRRQKLLETEENAFSFAGRGCWCWCWTKVKKPFFPFLFLLPLSPSLCVRRLPPFCVFSLAVSPRGRRRVLEEEEEETSFLIPLFLLSHSSPHHKQTKVKGGGGLYVHTYYISSPSCYMYTSSNKHRVRMWVCVQKQALELKPILCFWFASGKWANGGFSRPSDWLHIVLTDTLNPLHANFSLCYTIETPRVHLINIILSMLAKTYLMNFEFT